MAKKVQAADPTPSETPRPRLVKLIIKNFRCIGSTPVTIELDDIVVLVGPNNAGKSSILKAYEVIMSEGSAAGKLTLEDFPAGQVNADTCPEIELHTIVYDNSPGPEWVHKTTSGEQLVRERWTWAVPGSPVRRGFNVQQERWATDNDKEKVPWGAAGIANARRPQPHRVDAFASPEAQAIAIVKLLKTAIMDRVKHHQEDSKSNKESDFSQLLGGIAELQKKIVAESKEQISAVQDDLSGYIGRVFPGHRVVFDAKPEDDLDKAINLFKSNPQLLMGPSDGHMSTIGHQGSGAQRTLLWAAIRLLAESGKKAASAQRPHVLLLDEPEICLHPSAIREACDLLYGLPAMTDNWQVMITTHSPCFVDFARDHTSIVRVERTDDGQIAGTTIYRPDIAQFDDEDRENLKLLNICDPYVAEFFFGGKTVVVEGDTEYTAFKHVIANSPSTYEGVHVVRARGKATIVSLCKILNQFGAPYAVLHDSDKPTYIRKKDGKECKNPAWAHNDSIRAEMAKAGGATRLVASIPNFEAAYLGNKVSGDKPYNALIALKADADAFSVIVGLLDALLEYSKPIPAGALEWAKVGQLLHEVTK